MQLHNRTFITLDCNVKAANACWRAWGGAMVPLALLVFGSGCGTPKIAFGTRPIQPVASYQHTQTVDGFVLAVDSIKDPSEVTSLFGTDLLKADILPVLVVATNQSSDLSYVVSADQFRLRNGKWETGTGRATEAASKAGIEATSWITAIVGPGLLAAPFIGREVEKADIINQHFRHVQLLRKTLSAGCGTVGYV